MKPDAIKTYEILQKTLPQVLTFPFLEGYNPASPDFAPRALGYLEAFDKLVGDDEPNHEIPRFIFRLSVRLVAHAFGANEPSFCQFAFYDFAPAVMRLTTVEANAWYGFFVIAASWEEEQVRGEVRPNSPFLSNMKCPGERLTRHSVDSMLISFFQNMLDLQLERVKAILYYRTDPSFWYRLAGATTAEEQKGVDEQVRAILLYRSRL